MVSESGFEGVGGEADVGFVRFVVISAGNCGLVYHRFHETLAEEWAFVRFSAVAFVIFWFIRFQKDRLAMAVNGLFDVGHAGVIDFHKIFNRNNARNLFLCRHFANSSDRLFKDDLLFVFNKHSFSSRQRWQFFPPAVYAGTRFSIDHLISKSLSFRLNFQTYFDNSVLFSYLASLNDFL